MKAKLSTRNPDDWYVFWRDPAGRLFKKRAGMNRIKSIPERREFGKQLVAQMNRVLKDGVAIIDPPAVKILRDIVDSKRNSLRHRSWQSYTYAINSFEKWLPDKSVRMHEITRKDARDFLDSLSADGQKGKSINGMRGFLTAIFNHYAERNEGFVNPFKGTPKRQQDVGKNLAFTPDQQTQLWAAMTAELRLFTRFIYMTYIRPLELLRLRVSDVRMDMGQIIIQGHQSKNKRQQSVVIPDSFMSELQAMEYDKMPRDWYLFGRGLKPGAVPYGRNSVSKAHSKVLESLKYNNKDLTLYSWKHTGVIAAYRGKIDIYAIMRQLRHHSLDMTQIYLKSLGLERNEQFGSLMK